MQHQFHYNKKFYQDKKTGYWISTTSPRIRAHVWVWKYHNGEIKKGFHIHHKDGNKSNNQISNLECISVSIHFSKHDSEERRNKNLIHIETIRTFTKKWHSSEEGLKWHKEHGIKTWKERKPFWIICKECLNSFETKTYHQQFCSSSCKSKWRRRKGNDDIEKTCPVCESKYISNKYYRSKTCGRKCGKLLKNKIN